MNEVDQWIAVSDAGNGFEPFFDAHFPRAEKIVDFWHATEHLSPLSKLLRPGEEGKTLLTAWCHSLKHEGGATVLATLEALDRDAMTEATRVVHDEALTYFRNHVHKMNYPEYLRRGWQIGSGSMETGCKNVINKRLSMGGMRWGEEAETPSRIFAHCSAARNRSGTAFGPWRHSQLQERVYPRIRRLPFQPQWHKTGSVV